MRTIISNVNFYFFIFYISFAISLDIEPYHEYKLDKKYFISKVDNSFFNGGFVDNDFWNNITPVSGLIQVEPYFNQSPSYKTDIKLCYNENYIFVLVDLFQDQSSISYKKGEYDDFSGTFDSNSDYFIIEIDSYHDHETGYSFAVNSSGVQADYIIYNDEFIDDDWNADWYTDVVNTSYGWQIKYKIPFSILRYTAKQDNIWGINFIRYVKNNNEYISWTSVPDDKLGIVSHFGHLYGLRLENNKMLQFKLNSIGGRTFYDDQFYAYIIDESNNIVGLDFEVNSEQFFNQNITTDNIGFDIKHIINSNSNIDFTYKPDFNHIDQDPSDINNTAYETYFNERRDFFLENTIFFKTPMQIFYSKRIGGLEKNDNSYYSFLTNLEFASKYTYKDNNQRYGLILAYAKPSIIRNESYVYDIYSTIFRSSWKILSDRCNVGFIGTNKSTKQNNTEVYAVDFSSNFVNNQLYADGQIAISDKNNQNGSGYNFKVGFRSDDFRFLNRDYYIDFWIINNMYNKEFNINDLGYMFRNDLNEYSLGLSFNTEKNTSNTNFVIQHYKAKNYDNDILSDILSFKYNVKYKNSSYLLMGLSKEFSHYKDRYYDYFFDLDLDKIVKSPNNTTFNIEYGNNLTSDFSYSLNLKSFKNNLNDEGKNYIFDINYSFNSWIEFDFSYDRMNYYETYHFLKIRQLPSGINFNNITFQNFRDDYQYLFINSYNKEFYYTLRLSSYLDKCIIKLYSEYYVYNNSWGENDNIYQISKTDDNYIYPNPVNVEFASLIDYNTDKILYSAYYTSINFNFVLQFDFLENSNIYFLYRLNKGVNGKMFSNPKELLEFDKTDIGIESPAEIYHDHSFFLKYEFVLRK